MIVPDLMFATRIEEAARLAGAAVLSPIDQAAFLTALRNGARLVIIDSSTLNVPWLEWVRAAKGDPSTEAVPILAFGPHKDVELRNRALGAGVDRYLARSNFSEGLPEFVAAAARETTVDPAHCAASRSSTRGNTLSSTRHWSWSGALNCGRFATSIAACCRSV
jgi:DNA-binding response OmpR family regulator